MIAGLGGAADLVVETIVEVVAGDSSTADLCVIADLNGDANSVLRTDRGPRSQGDRRSRGVEVIAGLGGALDLDGAMIVEVFADVSPTADLCAIVNFNGGANTDLCTDRGPRCRGDRAGLGARR